MIHKVYMIKIACIYLFHLDVVQHALQKIDGELHRAGFVVYFLAPHALNRDHDILHKMADLIVHKRRYQERIVVGSQVGGW